MNLRAGLNAMMWVNLGGDERVIAYQPIIEPSVAELREVS